MSAKPSQAGTSQPAWIGRNHIAIFVHCLHLLDLDRFEDWPGVTEQTLTAKTAQQNLQQRIKAVEWCLYRLFELYDANETKDRLRPFFPPAAPLQSLNLRAALYRCLTELKKNGVLPKEILLRKTMLDECKGDKFEETIAAFGMIVLRKSLKNSDDATNRVISGQPRGSHVLPLILAYRKSLQDNLNKRNSLRQDHLEQSKRLDVVEQDLKQRIAEVNLTQEPTTTAVSQELGGLVSTNWIGDRRWVEILLHGRPIQSALDDPNSRNIVQSLQGESTSSSATNSLLDELDVKIHKHQSRLAEWKAIAKDLEMRNAKSNTISRLQPFVKPQVICTRFTKHRELHLGIDSKTQGAPNTITPKFQVILDNMRQELGGKETKIKEPVVQQTQLLDESENAQDISLEDLHGKYMTPDAKRVDYNHLEETSNDHHSQLLPLDMEASAKHIDIQHSPFPSSPISSLFDDPSSSWIPEHKSSATTVKTGSPDRQPRSQSPTLQQINNKQIQSPSSPTKDWLSLLDRTRASMAGFNSYKNPLDSDPMDQSTDATDPVEVGDDAYLSKTPPLTSSEISKATLMERTRQSMSLLSGIKIRPRKSQKEDNPRSSQLFPINQFETPRHTNTTTSFTLREVDEHFDSSRSSTPRDKLFDTEADYASVFKSRPKIAVSPPLSPERTTSGFGTDFDSGLETGVAGLRLRSNGDDDDNHDNERR